MEFIDFVLIVLAVFLAFSLTLIYGLKSMFRKASRGARKTFMRPHGKYNQR